MTEAMTRRMPPPGSDQAGPGPLPVGYTVHEFTIEATLGEGGFGIVYRAHDELLRRQVALKEYMPGSLALRRPDYGVTLRSERHRESYELGLRSFINEARLLASFDHPSLVKVYRFWEELGTAYMVMPYYQGPTLKAWQAEQRAAQAPGATEAWWRERLPALLDALQLMHDEQCYHRDIAPDNILLVGPRLWPVLLDFGAARRVLSDATQALTVILKPGYAPIEQYAEMPSLKQGAWTDVYALCAVLYNSVTGSTPPPAVARMVSDTRQSAVARAAGRYSETFLSGIDAGLAVLPKDRPQSLAELRELLGLPVAVADPLRALSATTQSVAGQGTGRSPASRGQPMEPTVPLTTPMALAPPVITPLQPSASGGSSAVASARAPAHAGPGLAPAGRPGQSLPDTPLDDAATVVKPRRPVAAPPARPADAAGSAGTAPPQPVAVPSAADATPRKSPVALVAAGSAVLVLAAAGWWFTRPAGAPAGDLAAVPAASAITAKATAAAASAAPGLGATPAAGPLPGAMPVGQQTTGPVPAPAPAPVVPPDQPPDRLSTRPPYTPVAAVLDIVQGADPAIQVSARADKSTLRIEKDKLQFRLRSSSAGHVYVVYVSSDGRDLQLLFPNALDKNNRVAANAELVLPRPGWSFTATGPAGTDHLAVLVSPLPRDFAAAGARMQGQDVLSTFDPATAARLWGQSDGKTSPYAGQARCDNGTVPCSTGYGAALIKVDEVR
jgi:serine/threonine protein kinase